MRLINWEEKYSVKIKDIDDQHSKLIDLINQLHEAMKEAKGKEVVGGIISELVSYTKHHFSAEEKLMKENSYPEYAKHKTEHDNLTNKVVEFQNSYKSGKAPLSMDLMQFLKDWLVNHIMKVDKEYSGFLNSKGIH